MIPLLNKKKLLILLFICPMLFGQNNFSGRKEFVPKPVQIHSQYITTRSNNAFDFTFLYKIPYSLIVFEKVNDHFEANFELTIEIKNRKGNSVKREFKKDKIVSFNFDETISNLKYLENFLSFELEPDDYTLQIIYQDKLSNRNHRQKPIKVNLSDSTSSLTYFLVKHKTDKNNEYVFANFSGMIPYSKEFYDLIVLSDKLSFNDKYIIKISNKDSLVYSTYSTVALSGKPVFNKSENNLIVTLDSSKKIYGLLLSEINKNLFEGKYKVELYTEDGKILDSFPLEVRWFDKPRSLDDSESALEMISIIETEENYDKLVSQRLSDEEILNNYWRTKDPTPQTSFNELLEEFYNRVDYTEENFRPLDGSSGATTDRGKIYINNGMPDRIERGVNGSGRIIESWYYDNPKRIFVFVDIRGDGNFKLESK